MKNESSFHQSVRTAMTASRHVFLAIAPFAPSPLVLTRWIDLSNRAENCNVYVWAVQRAADAWINGKAMRNEQSLPKTPIREVEMRMVRPNGLLYTFAQRSHNE